MGKIIGSLWAYWLKKMYPAMAAYQIEELLNVVLSKKEKILPSMRKKVDWHSFEEDLRFYIELIYRLEKW